MPEQYIGEIRLFTFGYAPEGWFLCDGKLYPIGRFQALYSILGNRFGGTEQGGTFGVPNLTGCAVAGPGGSLSTFGQTYGKPEVTLTAAQLPSHAHQMVRAGGNWSYSKKSSTPTAGAELGGLLINASSQGSAPTLVTAGHPNDALAPQTIGDYGALAPQAHENRQPTLTCIFAIAWDGDYPVTS